MKCTTREKFIENFGRFNDAPPRAKLDVAIVVMHQDRKAGEARFQHYFDNIDKEGHREYVKELAARLGVPLRKV